MAPNHRRFVRSSLLLLPDAMFLRVVGGEKSDVVDVVEDVVVTLPASGVVEVVVAPPTGGGSRVVANVVLVVPPGRAVVGGDGGRGVVVTGGGGVPPLPLTRMTPFIPEWKLQWYGNVPLRWKTT